LLKQEESTLIRPQNEPRKPLQARALFPGMHQCASTPLHTRPRAQHAPPTRQLMMDGRGDCVLLTTSCLSSAEQHTVSTQPSVKSNKPGRTHT
jgi:hypothetical protein